MRGVLACSSSPPRVNARRRAATSGGGAHLALTMLRRTCPLFAVVFSMALATLGACNDDDDGGGDDGADDAADDAGDDANGDDANGDDANGDDANGDDGPVDNVAACEDFVAAYECADVDLTQFVMCDVYANTTCDIADYFDCLADEVTCDAAGIGSAAMTCASLATCG